MTKDQFYIGQRVKQKDPDEHYMTYGKVKDIEEDKVIIDWDDPDWGLLENVEHFKDEWPSILPGLPSTN